MYASSDVNIVYDDVLRAIFTITITVAVTVVVNVVVTVVVTVVVIIIIISPDFLFNLKLKKKHFDLG